MRERGIEREKFHLIILPCIQYTKKSEERFDQRNNFYLFIINN